MDCIFGHFWVDRSLVAALLVTDEGVATLDVSVHHVDDLVHRSGIHSLDTHVNGRETQSKG